MSAPGDIHYARTSDGIDIAYTVFGEGPDLLVAPGFVTHLDLIWELPPFQGIRALGNRFRVIVLDKRGTGLSDRSLGFGSVEERTEDVRAVLDAVGSERAILYGISEGGPLSIYFAASQPDRVRALVLFGTFASLSSAPADTLLATAADQGLEASSIAEFIEQLSRFWGRGIAYQIFVSHPPDREAARRALARYERSACTPLMCREIMESNFRIDVRHFLPLISVPTLVLHCAHDPVVPVEHGRELARGIPGAELVEIDGDFHGSWRSDDMAKLAPPIGAFLNRVLGDEPSRTFSAPERELATILFTDIAASTERASALGDAEWKSLMDRHEQAVAAAIASNGGRLVETTGDGLLASFAGPSQAIGAARAVQEAALPLGVRVRAGVHTGEIERRGDRIGGLGVHIAARVMAEAAAGEILASRTVRDLAIGSRIVFADRGTHELKGVPQPWELFSVVVA